MMPMPPCCAIAMASRLSVTVSIAALRIGTFSRMRCVSRELTSTWLGSTCECRGTSRMSSNVSASGRPAATCAAARKSSRSSSASPRQIDLTRPWHFLYFLPLPQ